MAKVKIVWNGQGGELESREVEYLDDDDTAIAAAVVALIEGNVVTPGDSITIEAVEEGA